MIKMILKLRKLIVKRALIWIWMLIILMRLRWIKRNLRKVYHLLFKKVLLYLKIFQLLKVIWKRKILRKSNQCRFMLAQSCMLKECSRMVVLVSRKYLLSFIESQRIQNQKLINFSLSIIRILQIKMGSDIF